MNDPALQKSDWVGFIGLGAIGSYALGSVLFGSDFSELHIKFNFLDFPIFIGEILMAVCLVLLYIRNRLRPIVWTKWQQAMRIFLILIIVKALWDYAHGGPLALRNAALFYYSFFVLFGCVFYNTRFFSSSMCILIALILCFLTSAFHSVGYYWLTCAILFFVVCRRISSPIIRFPMIAIFFILCDYKSTFAGSRTNLLAWIGAIGFLMYVYLRYFLEISKNKKILWSVFAVFILAISAFFFGDKNGIRSIVQLNDLWGMYWEQKEEVQIKRFKGGYVAEQRPIQLYNDNNEYRERIKEEEMERVRVSAKRKKQKPAVAAPVVAAVVPAAPAPEAEKAPLVEEQRPAVAAVVPAVPAPEAEKAPKASQQNPLKVWVNKIVNENRGKSLGDAQGNMLFRIYIWEDMFRELVRGHHWFGVGLGKPQRSQTLEMLNWGNNDWQRDGWIAPHNTYFHVIYRLGLWGVLLIFIVFASLRKLTRFFLDTKSLNGILLVTVLIYWLTATGFLVILELPHFAILFWTVWGIAMAYADSRAGKS